MFNRTLSGKIHSCADKENLSIYYERTFPLMRKNGLIAIDITLRNSDVVNIDSTELRTVATRKLNDLLVDDVRVDVVLLPV